MITTMLNRLYLIRIRGKSLNWDITLKVPSLIYPNLFLRGFECVVHRTGKTTHIKEIPQVVEFYPMAVNIFHSSTRFSTFALFQILATWKQPDISLTHWPLGDLNEIFDDFQVVGWGISCKIALRWMSLFVNDQPGGTKPLPETMLN